MEQLLTKIVAERSFRDELCAVIKSFGNDYPYIGLDIEEWDDVNYPELFIYCYLPDETLYNEMESSIKALLSRFGFCVNESEVHLQLSDRFFDENIYNIDFIEYTLADKTDCTVEKLADDLWIIGEKYYLIRCK
ncbi:MAG: hypothetical protein HDS78_03220 [Bacteroidales bacterium]|nr:hypothetical protein [Bacteroidales bacterium]